MLYLGECQGILQAGKIFTSPVSGMAISNLITPDEGDTDTDSGNLLSPPPLLLSSPSFIEDTSDGRRIMRRCRFRY